MIDVFVLDRSERFEISSDKLWLFLLVAKVMLNVGSLPFASMDFVAVADKPLDE